MKRRKSTSATTNSWKYIFDDMWHVIELFQTHEELLVAELTREVGEMSPEFSAFLATLDNQIAGHESRPVNVGAICAETRDEWGGLEEQAKRRGCVLTTVREFVALGLLPGGTWPHASPSTHGYVGPVGIQGTRSVTSKSSSSSCSSSSNAPSATKRLPSYMDGSGASSGSPPEASRQRPTGQVIWRKISRKFHPNFIVEEDDGLRVAMLVEVLLGDDARGKEEDESNTNYETYLLRLIHSEHRGTGQKMPVNMNRSAGALFALSEVREFMEAVAAGGESAALLSTLCLQAARERRVASLQAASAAFPFGTIPPGSTMLRALKVINSAISALGETDDGGGSAAPTSSSSQSPDLMTGKETFSAERMAYVHYLHIECGLSMEKVPMALALTHLWWFNCEPNEKQIPSPPTIDASFRQQMDAEDFIFARFLEKTLKTRPVRCCRPHHRIPSVLTIAPAHTGYQNFI